MAVSNHRRATFLTKTEPGTYSFDDLEREGKTPWNGVRNPEARKNLRAMRKGDQVLIYHSGKAPAIVGLAEVVKEAYPEPGAEEWSVVEVKPVRRFKRPVTLSELRELPELSDWALLRRSRLSVVPVSPAQLECVLKLEKSG
ncbi:MAG TPA: EVE domain-containing protein [Polyangiaceae bacterium]|nr:EVE domain-containing protein [Polyangiaceae bacterium]